MIEIENNKYELIQNEKNAFNEVDFRDKVTEFFYEYDYIVGDYAYSKLRLKGFNDVNNKRATKINNYSNLNDYIKNNCAYNCKYFVLKKI